MPRVFIDTNIPIYAAASDHPLVEPARRVVEALADGRLDGTTDAEVFQGILYRYWHVGQLTTGLQIFDAFARIMAGRVLAVEEEDVRQARALAESYPRLPPRDLIHLALMLRHGIEEIVTADSHFDMVSGIRRLDPGTFPRPRL